MIPPVELWNGDLVVTGVGMVTPVGLDAPSASAALRAGLSRLGDLSADATVNIAGDSEPITGSEVPILTDGRIGPGRLSAMAVPALRECAVSAGLAPEAICDVLVGGPTVPWAGRTLDYREALAKELREGAGGCFSASSVEVLPAGRAAALSAVRQAALRLSQGVNGPILVGAVDTWVDELALASLKQTRRLREGMRGSGMHPGEGAAFLAIETPASAAARNATVLCRLVAAGGAVEPTPFGEPCKGVALSEVLLAVGQARSRKPRIVCDLNGEVARAHEWTFAFCRNPIPHEGDLYELTPAESVGDGGAGLGAIALAWSVVSLERGYAREGEVVVWGGSDEGAREAVLLRAEATA